ncbi:MAG TPA: oligosaccharide flippase family protein [Bryobacteraceae bacterium]|jgi:PST family polysaccharide transporter
MNRTLWESLASLYGVHAFNYLVPLFTLPYLARVLGAAEWGAFAFADAYGRVIVLVVEYGFGLSAAREVARVRHDPHARSRELSGVLGAQLLLGVSAALITMILANSVPVFAAHRRLLPGALFLAMSQGASPMWYFQGIERIKLMGSLWIAGRIAGAAGLFLFVREPGDGWLALFIQGTAPFLSVVAGLAIAYRDMPFLWPSVRRGWTALRSGGSVFLYRAGANLYTSTGVLLLGFLASPLAVAWFAGAEKIARAAVSATGPITQAFYPRINHLLLTDRRGAAQAARLSLWLTMSVGVVTGAALFFGAPLVVKIALGAGFEGSVPVLRLFALLPPVIAVSSTFGVQWMLALRLDRELNRIILAACVLDLVLAVGLGMRFHQIGVAVGVVLAEVFVAAASFLALSRRRLNPWRGLGETEKVAA